MWQSRKAIEDLMRQVKMSTRAQIAADRITHAKQMRDHYQREVDRLQGMDPMRNVAPETQSTPKGGHPLAKHK